MAQAVQGLVMAQAEIKKSPTADGFRDRGNRDVVAARLAPESQVLRYLVLVRQLHGQGVAFGAQALTMPTRSGAHVCLTRAIHAVTVSFMDFCLATAGILRVVRI